MPACCFGLIYRYPVGHAGRVEAVLVDPVDLVDSEIVEGSFQGE